MSHNLTTTGFLWVLLSVLSALSTSGGFFLPHWVEGKIYNTTVYLGVFRRCNFLVKRDDGLSVLERACGRYASFQDIPSEAWKASTVMMGIGCGILLLVALTAIFSCCLRDIVTKTSARVGGGFQFLAGKYSLRTGTNVLNKFNYIGVDVLKEQFLPSSSTPRVMDCLLY